MRRDLDDLRVLQLAALYESAYESFVRGIVERIRDPLVRERLVELAPEGDDHAARIKAEIDRRLAKLSADDQHLLERASLLSVIEVERAAREFYITHIDSVHDSGLVHLFQDLVEEEDRHVRLAEAALDAHEATGHARP